MIIKDPKDTKSDLNCKTVNKSVVGPRRRKYLLRILIKAGTLALERGPLVPPVRSLFLQPPVLSTEQRNSGGKAVFWKLIHTNASQCHAHLKVTQRISQWAVFAEKGKKEICKMAECGKIQISCEDMVSVITSQVWGI